MGHKTTSIIADDMKRFFTFAQELSKTVSRRVSQEAKLKEFLEMSLELGGKITQKNDMVLTANLALREQFNTINNICSVLSINIGKQQEMIGDIKTFEIVDPKIEKRLMYAVLRLSESVRKALSLIQAIIERSNIMILLDHRIGRLNASIGEQMKGFVEVLTRYRSMVGNDWRLYSANEIKKDFSEEFISRAERALASDDPAGCRKLISDLREELNFENGLSESMAQEGPLARELSRIGKWLYSDSNSVRNMVDSKYARHQENLEALAQLSVILSLEIEDYLKISDFFTAGLSGERPPHESRRLLNDLKILFDIASGSIESLVELNHYTVELFHTNAEREDHIVELSNMYLRCYDNIRKELDSFDRSVDSLSGDIQKNITLGQLLDKNLNKLMEEMT
jgi:hypothetical protein